MLTQLQNPTLGTVEHFKQWTEIWESFAAVPSTTQVIPQGGLGGHVFKFLEHSRCAQAERLQRCIVNTFSSLVAEGLQPDADAMQFLVHRMAILPPAVGSRVEPEPG